MVALTFHGDGDPDLAVRVLNALTAGAAPSTIFAVGSWLEANPGLARRALDGGHELANHTYRHLSMGQLGGEEVSEEIDRCRAVLAAQVAPAGLAWFRPSAMVEPNELVLERAGLSGYPTVIGYDVDSQDQQDPGSAAVVANVAAGVRAGSIVSLHLGHQGTLEALPGVLRALTAVGLVPVTVSTLLAGG